MHESVGGGYKVDLEYLATVEKNIRHLVHNNYEQASSPLANVDALQEQTHTGGTSPMCYGPPPGGLAGHTPTDVAYSELRSTFGALDVGFDSAAVLNQAHNQVNDMIIQMIKDLQQKIHKIHSALGSAVTNYQTAEDDIYARIARLNQLLTST